MLKTQIGDLRPLGVIHPFSPNPVTDLHLLLIGAGLPDRTLYISTLFSSEVVKTLTYTTHHLSKQALLHAIVAL